MPDKRIVSLSGASVQSHPVRLRPFEPAHGNSELITAITRHIERHVGRVDVVHHEICSDLVHIDLRHVAPTNERPYHFLITSGMSERPMPAPPGAENCRFAELLIALPPSWPMEECAWHRPEWFWPIRELKTHARFPHTVDSWVWYGHTIQSSDAEPYDRSVRFNSVALGPSYLVDPRFGSFEFAPDRIISFFALHFLFPEELQFKMRAGADALWDLFEKRGISEVVNPKRRNVCRRRPSPPRRGS